MIKQFLIIILFFLQLTQFAQNNKIQPEIIDIRIEDGKLKWTIINESSKEPYTIEQFRWNKWIKIGEVQPLSTQGQHNYSFFAMPHTGDNLLRVSQPTCAVFSNEVKWTSTEKNVIYSVNKKDKEINFSSETLYEIIDSTGKLVKKGWDKKIFYDNLPKGIYTLNYDNSTVSFKY
ncbi:MAG: hypothetical protein ACXVO9_09855 [Bacteroidia bacterium]